MDHALVIDNDSRLVPVSVRFYGLWIRHNHVIYGTGLTVTVATFPCVRHILVVE